VNSQKVADGVYWLTGGTHHSLAIEMNDYSVLVDTPNGETRALAVNAKVKELIPDKPIQYIVAMHHHWDHMGGIRTERWSRSYQRPVDMLVKEILGSALHERRQYQQG
jgi:glyoxylase-like metal-dependent hydrolase (beta-lactamase superfamily II)